MNVSTLIHPITESDLLDSEFGDLFLCASAAEITSVKFGNFTITFDSDSEVLFQSENRVNIKIGFMGRLTLTKWYDSVLFELKPFSGKNQVLEYNLCAEGTFNILQDIIGVELKERRTCLLNGNSISFIKGKFFLNPRKQELRNFRVKKKQRGNNLFVYHDLR